MRAKPPVTRPRLAAVYRRQMVMRAIDVDRLIEEDHPAILGTDFFTGSRHHYSKKQDHSDEMPIRPANCLQLEIPIYLPKCAI